MDKKGILVKTAVVALLVTSCNKNILCKESTVTSNNNQIPKTIQENKALNYNDEDNWNKIDNYDTNYVKLKDINKESVQEIKVDFTSLDGALFGEISDGYIVVGQEKYDTKDKKIGGFKYIPVLQKLDKTGKIVWEKKLDQTMPTSSIGHLLTFDDDSFLFSVEYPNWMNGQRTKEDSYIAKYDKEGNRIFIRTFNDSSDNKFGDILLTDTQEILVIGELTLDNSEDIVITKLDNKTGRMINKKKLKNGERDTLYKAKYDKEFGIIIKGETRTKDYKEEINFIACLDENLKTKWVKEIDKDWSSYNQLCIKDGLIYVGVEGYLNNANEKIGHIITIDNKGKDTTITNICDEYKRWAESIYVLDNHDIVVGCGNGNKGTIKILDNTGKEKKILKNLKMSPNEIIPTDDGGFIVRSIRNIETIPQPPVISSIWFDYEVVVMKYDNEYNIQWRKTYDQYKGTKELDQVIPLRNSKVIVEK